MITTEDKKSTPRGWQHKFVLYLSLDLIALVTRTLVRNKQTKLPLREWHNVTLVSKTRDIVVIGYRSNSSNVLWVTEYDDLSISKTYFLFQY